FCLDRAEKLDREGKRDGASHLTGISLRHHVEREVWSKGEMFKEREKASARIAGA
ncbi:hypothetical protein A2U01_0073117, partial [Trifolium medium]|nr:hypothetical protein [Trifolium medium]